ncbi:MAG: tetratricopeptide repeat protein, partial [Bacteroidia bacterium]
LFFGIHPMHVESVSWVSERKDVLYVFFFFAGLIAYLYYHKSKKIVWYLCTLVLFILSCLSKAMAVVFPIILLLIDYLIKIKSTLPLTNKSTAWWKQKNSIEKIPFFLISLGFGILAYNVQQGESIPDTQVFTFIQRIGFASYGAIMYLVKLIVPFKLSALYPYPAADGISLISYLYPFILLCLIAVVYFFMRKEKALVFGLLFYFVSVALVLQFITVGRAIIADRYSYLSSIGLLFAAAHLINLSWEKKHNILTPFKYPLAGIILTGAIAFSYLTYARTQVWMNSETLWTDAINKDPERCDLGYLNRGAIFSMKQDDNKALLDYNKALEINPTYAKAYYNRANIYYKSGQDDLAMADYNKSLELDPALASSYYNRALIFFKRGQDDLAMADYNRSIELNPGYAKAYNNRGVIYLKRKQNDPALADFLKAISLNSSIPNFWLNRSMSENALGKKEEARVDVIKAQQMGMQVDSSYLNQLGIKK